MPTKITADQFDKSELKAGPRKIGLGDLDVTPETPPQVSPVTATSEPFLTPQELLIATGATAGSMLAPEVAVPMALGRAAPFMQQAANLGIRALGAGAGGGAGSVVGDVGFGEGMTPEQIMQRGKEAAIKEAAFEFAAPIVGSALKKVLLPAADKISAQGKRILDFSRQIKAPVPPRAITPGFVSNSLQELLEVPLLGKTTADALRKKTFETINNYGVELTQQIAKPPGNSTVADAMRAVGNDLVDELKKARDDQFGVFTQSIVGRKYDSLELKGLMENILKNSDSPKIKKFIEEKVDDLGGTSNLDSVYIWLQNLDTIKGGGSVARDAKILREGLERVLQKNTTDEEYGALKKARDFLGKEIRPVLENTTFKRLVGRKVAPFQVLRNEQVTAELFKAGNEKLVARLQQATPPEVWDGLIAQNLKNILVRSGIESKNITGMRYLDGEKLKRILDGNQTVFRQVYGDDSYTALENLALISGALKKERDALESSANVTALRGLFNVAGGVGSLQGIVVSNATAPALVWDLMRPNGALKRWLTTASKSPIPPSVMMGAGRLGAAQQSQEDEQ